MSKPSKRRVKWLRKIAANPMRTTPLVPGRETDYIFEDDPKEIETMCNERHRQNSLAKLQRLAVLFAEQELEYLRRKCAAQQAVIDADNAWYAIQAEREAELKKVRDWWASEREKELKAEDGQRRKRLAKATEQINRDTVRREREEFGRRGVIRGRKR